MLKQACATYFSASEVIQGAKKLAHFVEGDIFEFHF